MPRHAGPHRRPPGRPEPCSARAFQMWDCCSPIRAHPREEGAGGWRSRPRAGGEGRSRPWSRPGPSSCCLAPLGVGDGVWSLWPGASRVGGAVQVETNCVQLVEEGERGPTQRKVPTPGDGSPGKSPPSKFDKRFPPPSCLPDAALLSAYSSSGAAGISNITDDSCCMWASCLLLWPSTATHCAPPMGPVRLSRAAASGGTLVTTSPSLAPAAR